jgi:hypothetical protein
MSNGSKKLKQEPRMARHCRSPMLWTKRKSNKQKSILCTSVFTIVKSNCHYRQSNMAAQKKSIVTHVAKKFPTFVETEGLLPCSKHHTIGPYSEPVESSPFPLILSFKIHFNIIQHSTPRSPVISSLPVFLLTFFMHFLSHHAYYVSRLSHYFSIWSPRNIWRGIHIRPVKILIMQCASCCSTILR